jgi:hypothetical protein
MNAFHRSRFQTHPKDSLNGSKESVGPVANRRRIANPPLNHEKTILSFSQAVLSFVHNIQKTCTNY